MSYGRFAPITSDLLARKGEARPWAVVPAEPVPNRPLPGFDLENLPPRVTAVVARPVPSPVAAGGSPPAIPAVRKCTIRMSAHDFERLGIIAVKDDTTRQHLLQQALADLLAAKERQYRAACRCMAPDPGPTATATSGDGKPCGTCGP